MPAWETFSGGEWELLSGPEYAAFGGAMAAGWTNFPPIAGQGTANSWAWHDQLRRAILEKYQAANIAHYPRTPHIWGTASITAQGIDGRGFYVDFTPALTCEQYDPEIINTGAVGNRGDVDQFAVVVQDSDPKKCVRLGDMSVDSFPVGHGATSTRLYLTPPPANHPDYLDYEAIVGKVFHIITGYSEESDPWWNERWMQPPNDVIANRTVTESDTQTCSPGVLIDTTIRGKAAAYAGQHLWIGEDRFVIDAVDDTSITFSNPNVSPLPTLADGDAYAVIHADGFYKPGNAFYCWKWHDVIDEAWYAHDHTLTDAGPNGGQVGTTNLRATTVRMLYPDGDGNCPLIGEPADITENDVWVAMTNWCENPNTTKTPWLFRTLRGTQLAVQGIAPSFVKDIDYTGAKAIPQYVPATWFAEAGINVLTLTGTAAVFDTDHWEVSVNAADFDTFPDGALEDGVYWALVDTTFGNTVIASGRAYQASDIPATITIPCDIPRTAAGGGNPAVSQQENVTSDPYEYGTPHTVVWVCSAGWTRKHPAEFRYAYERTGFVPEMYTETIGLVTTTYVADPPTAAHPGTYDTRPASTHLLRPDLHGRMLESAFDYDAIADGMLARYMGDVGNDPGLTETEYVPPAAPNRRLVETTADDPDGTLAPRLWYADQFRETIDFQGGVGTRGTATAGGTTFLTDTDRSWWPQGSLITHTGTASSGSTTSLTTGATDGFWDQVIDSHGRFEGMAVEVEVTAGVWEKRFIADHTADTITWGEALSTSANGKAFRITEPRGRLNYWKGRTITLTSPDGATVYADVPIIGSDDDTIYFAAQAGPVAAGWQYQVKEMLPGAVYERSGGAWALPAEASGSASRAKHVHPDTLTRYGYARKRDYVTRTIYSELRTGLDLLSATKNGLITWSHEEESNHREGDGTGIDSNPGATLAAAWASAEANVAAGPPGWDFDLGPTAGAPLAGGSTSVNYDLGGWKVDLSVYRRFAYPTKTTLPPYLAGSVDLYVYGATTDGGFEYLDEQDGLVAENTFNAYGDPVTYRTWNKFETLPITNDVLGAKFGSILQPTLATPTIPVPDPVTGDITSNGGDGYSILSSETVCRWAMSFHA